MVHGIYFALGTVLGFIFGLLAAGLCRAGARNTPPQT